MKFPLPILDPQGTDQEMLSSLKLETFDYFIKGVHPESGLIPDSTRDGSPTSIAVMGLALSCYVVAVENGWISRREALEFTLKVLKFFHISPQGTQVDAAGHKGFYYHFLEMESGRRAWKCELSTIDTAILMAGVLTVGVYFDQDHKGEDEVRKLSHELYARVDWNWALNEGHCPSHGWKPESGFLPYRWNENYSEAHILYILALGSPSFPIEAQGYFQWTSTFKLRNSFDLEYIHAGPLFIHQMSQIWIDMKGIRDELNQKINFDYFENSRRATQAQQKYSIKNPHGFSHYDENCWGITASEGPGPCEMTIDGKKRTFYDYIARGAPDDIDDGTISPWAVTTSVPFAPEITIPTIRHAIERLQLKNKKRVYGFDASFNPTFPERDKNPNGWVSPWRLGLNHGPIVLMLENYQTQFIWNLLKNCDYIKVGLKKPALKEDGLKALTVNPKIKSSVNLKEVPPPSVKEGSLLLEMVAVGICGTDREISEGEYGWAPEGSSDLIIGHESLGRVVEGDPEGTFKKGDLVVGIVRRPDPVPCSNCAVNEWDMCRNGQYTERGIKGRNGFLSDHFRLEPEFAIKVDKNLGELAVLLEPTSVVAKAWEHTFNIGKRARFLPKTALITGAGPVGLLAALMGKQKDLAITVLDRVTEGLKVSLVKELGATYHTDLDQLKKSGVEFDIILECTGATDVLFEVAPLSAADGVICLAGVSSGAHDLKIDVGTVERHLVLENQVIFGSVNAGKRHYEQAAEALAKADPTWLKKLITRRVPLERWKEAFELHPDDIKNIIVGASHGT